MQSVVWFVGACFVTGVLWLMVQLAKWSAPLSGVAGLALGVTGVYVALPGLMSWGFGLFGFSALLFVFGGGMKR
jgi:hypothetical protein